VLTVDALTTDLLYTSKGRNSSMRRTIVPRNLEGVLEKATKKLSFSNKSSNYWCKKNQLKHLKEAYKKPLINQKRTTKVRGKRHYEPAVIYVHFQKGPTYVKRDLPNRPTNVKRDLQKRTKPTNVKRDLQKRTRNVK